MKTKNLWIFGTLLLAATLAGADDSPAPTSCQNFTGRYKLSGGTGPCWKDTLEVIQSGCRYVSFHFTGAFTNTRTQPLGFILSTELPESNSLYFWIGGKATSIDEPPQDGNPNYDPQFQPTTMTRLSDWNSDGSLGFRVEIESTQRSAIPQPRARWFSKTSGSIKFDESGRLVVSSDNTFGFYGDIKPTPDQPTKTIHPSCIFSRLP
jgi:hypothetical protein